MPPGCFCPASISHLHLPLLLLLSFAFLRTAAFCPPTARAALEHVSVMQQAVQHGGDGGAVAEQFAPVVYGSVGCEKSAGAFIAAHDDFQQFFGGGQR